MSSMLSFHMGYCCLHNYNLQKENQCLWNKVVLKVHYMIVVLTRGILLPIASKILSILGEVRTFKFDITLEEKGHLELISNSSKKFRHMPRI